MYGATCLTRPCYKSTRLRWEGAIEEGEQSGLVINEYVGIGISGGKLDSRSMNLSMRICNGDTRVIDGSKYTRNAPDLWTSKRALVLSSMKPRFTASVSSPLGKRHILQ